MSVFRDAAYNIRDGFVSMWTGMSEAARMWCMGFVTGIAVGVVGAGFLLC